MIVGEANSGKTSLARSLLAQPFARARAPTPCLNVVHARARSSSWKDTEGLREDYAIQAVVEEVNKATPTPEKVVEALARKRRSYSFEAAEVERILRTKHVDLGLKSNQKHNQKQKQKEVASLGLSIWDFGGLGAFQHLHTKLLSAEGVYVVVFNMANCLKKKKSTCANIAACVQEVVNRGAKSVLIVGTHMDRLERKQKSFKEIDAHLAKLLAPNASNVVR